MVPDWNWTLNKPNKLDFEEYFGVVRRTLGVIGAIFTIWIFVETRQKKSEKETTNELIGEMNLQLENLNVRVEEVRKSLLHLSCLYDAVQVQTKSKIVSRNCLQFIQQYQHAATYAPQLANPSRLVIVRQNKKQSSSPTLIGWLGHNQ